MTENIAYYKHIIWDWNGTLLNDTWISIEILNEMLDESGHSRVNLFTYLEKYSEPILRFFEEHSKHFNKWGSEKAALEEYSRRYEIAVLDSSLYDGALNMVKSIYNTGIEQSVVATRPKKQLIRETKFYSIFPFMKHVIGLRKDMNVRKIGLVSQVLDRISYHTDEVLYVGNSYLDANLADGLNLNSWIITHGHQTFDNEKYNNSQVISNFRQIII